MHRLVPNLTVILDYPYLPKANLNLFLLETTYDLITDCHNDRLDGTVFVNNHVCYLYDLMYWYHLIMLVFHVLVTVKVNQDLAYPFHDLLNPHEKIILVVLVENIVLFNHLLFSLLILKIYIILLDVSNFGLERTHSYGVTFFLCLLNVFLKYLFEPFSFFHFFIQLKNILFYIWSSFSFKKGTDSSNPYPEWSFCHPWVYPQSYYGIRTTTSCRFFRKSEVFSTRWWNLLPQYLSPQRGGNSLRQNLSFLDGNIKYHRKK